MFENFTESARKVLGLARQEALKFRHEYTGTEHILLSLIIENTGVAAEVFKKLRVDLRRVRAELDKRILPSTAKVSNIANPPYTPRLRRVFEIAREVSSSMGDSHVGTEHLLAGLLIEREGIAATVLFEAGVELDLVNSVIVRLKREPPTIAAATPAPKAAPIRLPVLDNRISATPGGSVPRAMPSKGLDGFLCPSCGVHIVVPRGFVTMKCNKCGASLALVGAGGVSALKQLPPDKVVPYTDPQQPTSNLNTSTLVAAAWRGLLSSKRRLQVRCAAACAAFASLAVLSGFGGLSMLHAVVHASRITMEPAMTALLATMGAVPIFGYVAGYFWDKYAMLRTEIADMRRHLPHDNF